MTQSITTREPLRLTSANVEHIFFECLTDSMRETNDAIIIRGVNITPAFDRERIAARRDDIIAMLEQLPDTFHVGFGGGWSFLNLCIDRNGEQWTDFHRVCDNLMCLGMAIGAVEYTVKQRDICRAMPGGMPYITININNVHHDEKI